MAMPGFTDRMKRAKIEAIKMGSVDTEEKKQKIVNILRGAE